ncbi:hypothetical protein HMPREF9306_00201 [Propionimicrobium lymphophilum ACS-093-V-SCH5]|uniref:Helix-turn-helix domain-containing protein n=1 Tax=Propionimicrobium lymphophilum ACS-093-V-SCH5 TaxID=883161 RepID=S2WM93_9ACTN|nr:hypothetical protein [Propionimicrobium lymphophilum]EPD33787.1 hypothetical protein HMPREF9306_00201 [Propionimicrobium lymphophilum ACS-093-V-SCH5]
MQEITQKRQTLTPREASEVLGLSRRQVERLAQPGGPLEASRRDPILIDAEKVQAFKAVREGAA